MGKHFFLGKISFHFMLDFFIYISTCTACLWCATSFVSIKRSVFERFFHWVAYFTLTTLVGEATEVTFEFVKCEK